LCRERQTLIDGVIHAVPVETLGSRSSRCQ
jgi:hypothetical protein